MTNEPTDVPAVVAVSASATRWTGAVARLLAGLPQLPYRRVAGLKRIAKSAQGALAPRSACLRSLQIRECAAGMGEMNGPAGSPIAREFLLDKLEEEGVG